MAPTNSEGVEQSGDDGTETPRVAVPEDGIGLRWAITNALERNLRIRALTHEVDARDALNKDAALLPNPELEGEIENVGGSGPLAGFDGVESKALASQKILLGGKRRKRARVAELDKELANWRYETARLQVVTETTLAFLDTLSSQRRVALAKELVRRAEEVYETVREQSEAGEVSPIEPKRARIPLERRRIELEEARAQLQSARQRLAAKWGRQVADFSEVKGSLDDVEPVPETTEILSRMGNNPDVARWATELEHERARLRLEKARRIPNIKLKGGIKNDQRGSQTTYIGAISIPLQLFDRSQYQVKAARARLERAEALREEILVTVRADIEGAYREVEAAYHEATRLQKVSLPNAREAHESVQEGFRVGKFGFLDVLEAQRTLFDVREQLLTAQTRYQKAISKLERLIGQSMASIPDETEKSSK